MAVSEVMLLLEDWRLDRETCRLRKDGLCSYWSIPTLCCPKNCARLDPKARKQVRCDDCELSVVCTKRRKT